MAEIKKIIIEISLEEAKAVHFATGNIKHSDFPSAEIAAASSEVYDMLCPIIDALEE